MNFIKGLCVFKYIIILITISFFALPLAAQETDPAEDDAVSTTDSFPADESYESGEEEELGFYELENQTVSAASKIEQTAAEAPSIISIISAKQFKTFGWKSINDALYHMPGFTYSQDYDRRTVSSRGIFEGWNNNHYMMLVDGVQFNDNAYGSAYTWEITPVNMIKTMEVVRGRGRRCMGRTR
ncbi:MAG: Plug domain-containing protein [bacterium]|nr:Plug domain-containing protein [bacterium]